MNQTIFFKFQNVQVKFLLQKLINDYQILPCQENLTFMLFKAKSQKIDQHFSK